MAIATACTHRIISKEVLYTIAGVPPIDLFTDEMGNKKQKDKIPSWKDRWTLDTSKARWTKVLINKIEEWLGRKFGSVI